MADIGIDLGTANTLIYVKGRGVIFNQATAIAIDDSNNQVLAIGNDALNMIGRTPPSIRVIRPLSTGVISDYVAAKTFLDQVLRKIVKRNLFQPIKVVIGVPSRISGAEFKAMKDTLNNSKISKVYAVQEPVAAAIGSNLNFSQPRGCLIIDVGAGTTDIALLSLGRVVDSKSIKIGGDAIVASFINHLANNLRLNVGPRTAEMFLNSHGQALLEDLTTQMIQGVDMSKGLPVHYPISSETVYEAIKENVQAIVGELRRLLDSVPPDLATDALVDGINLTGGGSLLSGLSKLLTQQTGINCSYVEEPMLAVVKGCGAIIEDLNAYKFILEATPDELSGV